MTGRSSISMRVIVAQRQQVARHESAAAQGVKRPIQRRPRPTSLFRCQPWATTVLRNRLTLARARTAGPVRFWSSISRAHLFKERAHRMQTATSGWLPRRTSFAGSCRVPQHQQTASWSGSTLRAYVVLGRTQPGRRAGRPWFVRRMGWLIGRVLFAVPPLDATVGDHPSRGAVADALVRPTRELGRAALERSLSGLAPGGVYRATTVARRAGGLLHHRFTLTAPRGGGLLSVALSRGLPRVGVAHHLALWSPDLPRRSCLRRGRPASPSACTRIGHARSCVRRRSAGCRRARRSTGIRAAP